MIQYIKCLFGFHNLSAFHFGHADDCSNHVVMACEDCRILKIHDGN